MAILSKRDVLASLLVGSVLLASGSNSWAQDATTTPPPLSPKVQQTLDIFRTILGTPQQPVGTTTETTTETTVETTPATEAQTTTTQASETTTETVTTTAKTAEELLAENEALKQKLSVLQDMKMQEHERRLEHFKLKQSDLERHIRHMQEEKASIDEQVELLEKELGKTEPVDAES